MSTADTTTVDTAAAADTSTIETETRTAATITYIVTSASGFRDVPYGASIDLEPAEVNAAIAEGFTFSLPHPHSVVLPAFSSSHDARPVNVD